MNHKLIHKIWNLLTSQERKRALMLFGVMLGSMVLETFSISLVIPAVAFMTQESLLENYPVFWSFLQVFGNPDQKTLVVSCMLMLVGVYLFKAFFLAFLIWRQTHFVFSVQAELSTRLFSIYLHQPYTFHLQRNSAQLIRNVTTEVGLFTSALTHAAILITEALVVVGIASLLLVLEPLNAIFVVVVLGVMAWIFQRSIRNIVVRWGEARQFHEGLRIQHLQQGLGGAKDVKLLGREGDFLSQYNLHNTQSVRVGGYQSTVVQFPRLGLELLAVLGLVFLVLSMLAQGRELDAILPTLGIFAAAAFRLLPSVNKILAGIQQIRYGLPVLMTLYEELNLPVAPPLSERKTNVTTLQDEIRLIDVSFAYPSSRVLALNQISLRIRQGELVGFIGASGAGKSTLVDVILGLFTPTSGHVTVDRRDIHQDLRAWQDQIGYVSQSIYLTDDTVRRNVAFGVPPEQIDDLAVQRAIAGAQLEEFILNLPQGIETVVGERGARISGGQKQRIGIARALYHDPAVLVLDEATSALDSVTEKGVIQTITALQGQKTVLVVAHRQSTVETCDRLYRLERGKVVKEGVPSAMLYQPAMIG